MDESTIEPIPVLPRPAVEDVGGVVAHHLQEEDDQQHQFHHGDREPTDASLLDPVPHLPPPVPEDFHVDGAAPATDAADCVAALLKRDADQDVATLNHDEAKRQKTSSAANVSNLNKKDRNEFTATEKLRIINLLEGNIQDGQVTIDGDGSALPQQPALTNKQIREKFGVSKSSLHRWKQQKHRLQIMVQSEGLGNRKRDTKDPLEKVKVGLQQFYNENSDKSPEERLIITTAVVQAMACKIRDDLLAEYDAAVADAAADAAIGANDGQQQMQQEPPELKLNEEEITALRGFKVTKSWAGRVASSMGWLSQPRKKSTHLQQEEEVEEQLIPIEGDVDDDAAVVPDDTTAANTEQEAAEEKAKLNTLAFLSKTHPDYSATNPKAKKIRKEFTAVEKLAIITEMDPQQTSNPLVMAEICEKYSTSKSSVFRWKQQYRAGTLTQMINEEGRGSFKRDVNDKLSKLKLLLRDVIEDNQAQSPETRAVLSSGVLQGKAQQFRDELLAQHDLDTSKSDLKDDEVEALKKFRASKGWARRVASRYGWKDMEDPKYGVAAALRTEAAASVAAAEVSVDALMGDPHTAAVAPSVDVTPLAQHESENDDVVMMSEQEQNHHEHEDAVNEVMESFGVLAGTEGEVQFQV